ncbi:hypothetical protein [Blautia argi]|uniref:hypothetical protein n=1 Tax=Blautia argi TaxID=1912897 RepID=UPI001FA8364F|nr:hypothetical protein [Blautia argi]
MLKFVTFNIRCDYNQDKDNSFCFRKQEIEEKLEREQPDIYLLSGGSSSCSYMVKGNTA